MRRVRIGVLSCVLGAAIAPLCSGNGPVRFEGTVTTAEQHDVVPVCYGDYFRELRVDNVREDPNGMLAGVDRVQVCYPSPLEAEVGAAVEVYGTYWNDGTCPRQYCGSVQISEKDKHFIRTLSANGRAYWLDLLAPAGRVPGLALGINLPGSRTWWMQRDPDTHNLTIGQSFPYPPFDSRAATFTPSGALGLGKDDPAYRLDLPNEAGPGGQARAQAWLTYSSRRWKTEIETIQHATETVKKLRGVTFRWQGSGTADLGLVAEEVDTVVPEVVSHGADGTQAEAVAYDRLVALLVEALKEQDARIATLEKTVAALSR